MRASAQHPDSALATAGVSVLNIGQQSPHGLRPQTKAQLRRHYRWQSQPPGPGRTRPHRRRSRPPSRWQQFHRPAASGRSCAKKRLPRRPGCGMYGKESAGFLVGQYSTLEERRARNRVHQAATQFCFVRKCTAALCTERAMTLSAPPPACEKGYPVRPT